MIWVLEKLIMMIIELTHMIMILINILIHLLISRNLWITDPYISFHHVSLSLA